MNLRQLWILASGLFWTILAAWIQPENLNQTWLTVQILREVLFYSLHSVPRLRHGSFFSVGKFTSHWFLNNGCGFSVSQPFNGVPFFPLGVFFVPSVAHKMVQLKTDSILELIKYVNQMKLLLPNIMIKSNKSNIKQIKKIKMKL